MSRLFVTIATGPENPTRPTLGMLIARAALKAGHEVDLLFAGDAVHLLRRETLEATQGVGIGGASQLFDDLVNGGAHINVSAMSSKVRGIDVTNPDGRPIEFVSPDQVVEILLRADRSLSF